jgi:hypothetical protein
MRTIVMALAQRKELMKLRAASGMVVVVEKREMKIEEAEMRKAITGRSQDGTPGGAMMVGEIATANAMIAGRSDVSFLGLKALKIALFAEVDILEVSWLEMEVEVDGVGEFYYWVRR